MHTQTRVQFRTKGLIQRQAVSTSERGHWKMVHIKPGAYKKGLIFELQSKYDTTGPALHVLKPTIISWKTNVNKMIPSLWLCFGEHQLLYLNFDFGQFNFERITAVKDNQRFG